MNGFKVKIRLHLIYGIFDVVEENVSSFASRLSASASVCVCDEIEKECVSVSVRQEEREYL